MLETTVILRSALLHVMSADSHEKAVEALKVMCTEDDIAAVEKQLNALKKLDSDQK
jgi:hypothetical protein